MRIHFYKLQIGGNGFILVDTTQEKDLSHDSFSEFSKSILNRRYGVGASVCIFFCEKNALRFFLPTGEEIPIAYDALFCAARYAFDSGRISKATEKDESVIHFNTLSGDIYMRIISSREFKISIGSPFSLINKHVLTKNSTDCIETLKINEKPVCVSGMHIINDVLSVVPQIAGARSFFEFYTSLRKTVQKKINLVFTRVITKETISIRTLKRGPSTETASAAAALVASAINGASDTAAVCIFEEGNPSLQIQQSKLSNDKDNSRKLAIIWNTEQNEIYVIGTGGYVFEGFYEL